MTNGPERKQYGEVSEWPKEHAWKVCIRKRIEGSNPSLTATLQKTPSSNAWGFFVVGYKKLCHNKLCQLHERFQ